jgi:hypothetical protein
VAPAPVMSVANTDVETMADATAVMTADENFMVTPGMKKSCEAIFLVTFD